MPRPPDQAKRAELLAGVIDYLGEHGLTELSLRPLAAHLGTSSRMLIHYFGTKEDMLVAALETQRPDIAGMFGDVHDAQTLRERLWQACAINLTEPVVASSRVLLEVLGAASLPHCAFREYANAAVQVLVNALAAVLSRIDPPAADPLATATILVSGIRGLIQDWLITGDSGRVNRAARLLIDQAVPPPA